MLARSRSGLTLIELLVVVAIIGILMALLLPAVQQSRESARATQCRNNLHQIGIGLHSYYSAHNSFPPGCVGTVDDSVNLQGWGWGTFLLPYLDQGALYQSLHPTQNTLPVVLASAELQPYLRTHLPVYRCPSDPGEELQNDNRTLSGFVLGVPTPPADPNSQTSMNSAFNQNIMLACIIGGTDGGDSNNYGVRAARSNYVASFGDFWLPVGSLWGPTDLAGNGAFGSNVSFRLKDITDGASQTFAIGERSSAAYASIWAGTDGWNRCEREGLAMVLSTAHYAMNSAPNFFNMSCDPQGAAAFASMHPHGLQFLMVDGSVRTVSDTVGFANDPDPSRLGVFQRLARRNDGQQVGDF
jgi:prepilin-type N-terminal cleavage/methylation domain-containing protein